MLCVLVLYVYTLSGSGLLVLTTVDVDKSGASYYGEQGLHYLSVRGDGNMVHLGKENNVVIITNYLTYAWHKSPTVCLCCL